MRGGTLAAIAAAKGGFGNADRDTLVGSFPEIPTFVTWGLAQGPFVQIGGIYAFPEKFSGGSTGNNFTLLTSI